MGFFILHEGPIGVLDGTLKEIDYDDLTEDGPQQFDSTGGWVGFTDKYWLGVVDPRPGRGGRGDLPPYAAQRPGPLPDRLSGRRRG